LTFIFKNLEPVFYVQWNLCNLTPEFSILWHPIKIYDPKVFLLTKIKPEYFHILYNPTYFLGPLVCQIRQVPLYHYSCVFLYGSGTGLSSQWMSWSFWHFLWHLTIYMWQNSKPSRIIVVKIQLNMYQLIYIYLLPVHQR
jgi:hypothetical protein